MDSQTRMTTALKGALVVACTVLGMVLLSTMRSPLGIGFGFVLVCTAFLISTFSQADRARPKRSWEA